MALAPITSGTVPVLPDAELNGQSEGEFICVRNSNIPTTGKTPISIVPTLESSTGDYESAAPTYPGEDTRPTSEKELRAWYAYAWAAEPYVV
ncbi:hypothetical protein FRC08_011256, partial [Ceratobasidium sp. 394]